jgi:hypothetical protein
MYKLLIPMLCLGSTVEAATAELSLKEAINLRKVEATFKPNGYAIGECVKGEIKNLTSDTLLIKVEAGTFFKCLSTNKQDLYVTRAKSFRLEKNASTVEGFMCLGVFTEYAPPSADDDLVVQNPSNKYMPGLCKIIDSLELNCQTGQTAVNALIYNLPMSSVIGAFVPNVNAVRLYLAKSLNVPFTDFASQFDLLENPLYRKAIRVCKVGY